MTNKIALEYLTDIINSNVKDFVCPEFVLVSEKEDGDNTYAFVTDMELDRFSKVFDIIQEVINEVTNPIYERISYVDANIINPTKNKIMFTVTTKKIYKQI